MLKKLQLKDIWIWIMFGWISHHGCWGCSWVPHLFSYLFQNPRNPRWSLDLLGKDSPRCCEGMAQILWILEFIWFTFGFGSCFMSCFSGHIGWAGISLVGRTIGGKKISRLIPAELVFHLSARPSAGKKTFCSHIDWVGIGPAESGFFLSFSAFSQTFPCLLLIFLRLLLSLIPNLVALP